MKDVDILEQLATAGVKVELVVGPSGQDDLKDKQSLARLGARGVTVSQIDTTIEQPVTIVDGRHARMSEPEIPGRGRKLQYVVYDAAHIYEYNQRFESLAAKAHKP